MDVGEKIDDVLLELDNQYEMDDFNKYIHGIMVGKCERGFARQHKGGCNVNQEHTYT